MAMRVDPWSHYGGMFATHWSSSFDVGPGGEVVIPIDAKLRVGRPTAFAITLEKAGGVVVSDGPLLLVAAVNG